MQASLVMECQSALAAAALRRCRQAWTWRSTAKLAACLGGRGRIAKRNDNARFPQLCRPPFPGRDHLDEVVLKITGKE